MPDSPDLDTALAHARRILDGYGRHLNATRKHYKVSLRQLGDELGLDYGMLSRVENASAIPPPNAEVVLREWLLQHPLPVDGDMER